MKLLRSFPSLAFAMVLLSIVGISIAQRSVGLLLVAGALAAISWYVTEGPRGRWLPRWVSNVLVIAVTLNVAVDAMQHTEDMLGVLGRFILWLVIIKLYERRTARDHAHLLGLSLLLMVTGCLQSVDLFFAIILALYAALGFYVVVLYQLHAAYERSRELRLAAVPKDFRLAPSVRPITGPHLALQFRSLVVLVAVVGFLLGMIVFVAFPRGLGEGSVYGLPSPSREQRTGFTENVDLIRGGRITESRRAVMSVQVTNHAGQVAGMHEPLLLRGAVLNRYEGRGQWRRSPGALTDLRVGPDHFRRIVPDSVRPVSASSAEQTAPGVLTLHVELLRPMETLFSLYPPIAVSTDSEQVVHVDRDALTIKQRSDAPGMKRYQVQSHPRADDSVLDRLTVGTDTNPGHLLRLRNEAVRELAHEILASAGVPHEPQGEPRSNERWQWNTQAADAIMRYLHSSEFQYTTDLSNVVFPTTPRGRPVDPIRYFLFELRRGHCEYFAAAMVALCYNVGIEARMVTGYVAHDFDAASRRYNVVEANAHAWTEVRTGRHRWTTFDPTPPAVLRDLHSVESSVADRLRWFYDSFDGAWGRTVVDFDRAQQTRLAESSFTTIWSERISSGFRSIRAWLDRVNRAFYLGQAGYIYMAFVACILIFAVLVLIKLMRRSMMMTRVLRLRHVRGRDYQRMLRQLGFYLDMLHVLKRAGYDKPPWQPPMMFAHTMQQQHPDAAHLVRSLTDAFYAARYGGRGLSREQMDQARTWLHDLEAMLRSRS